MGRGWVWGGGVGRGGGKGVGRGGGKGRWEGGWEGGVGRGGGKGGGKGGWEGRPSEGLIAQVSFFASILAEIWSCSYFFSQGGVAYAGTCRWTGYGFWPIGPKLYARLF